MNAAAGEASKASHARGQTANPAGSRPRKKLDSPAPTGFWPALARHWSRLGPPLRPVAEDVQRLHTAWIQSRDPAEINSRKIDILLLGTTPELAVHRWAEDFQLWAIDGSESMIETAWPGDSSRRKIICGNWLNAPFAAASFDLIVSDAGLTPLAAPGQIAALGTEMRRLIRPRGRIVMRHFARCANPVPFAQLVQMVATGTVRNFHELKLRLLLGLSVGTTAVQLGEAWNAFQKWFPDRNLLAEQLGCSLETISTVDAYRDRDARYVFPTLDELAREFRSFALTLGPSATYPLAECCPVFTFSPRP